MKNCRLLATIVRPPDYSRGSGASSAEEKAIVGSSTGNRHRLSVKDQREDSSRSTSNSVAPRSPRTRSWRSGTQKPGKTTRPQVHADAVGLQHFGWALQVYGHQARRDAARP